MAGRDRKGGVPLESAVQKRIVDHYRRRGFMVLKVGICNMPGWPDLQLMKDGRVWFAEVKRPGGKPTDLQKAVHERLRANGFDVRVLEGVPDDGWPWV